MIHGIVSIVIIVIVFILYTEIRKWQIKKKLGYFESPRQLPIIGVAAQFIGKSNDQIIETILQLYDQVEGSPFQAWFGPFLSVCIREPHDMQCILTSEHCLNKPYLYNLLPCKFGLINIHKELWKTDRRALNVAFNVKMLQNYIPMLNEKSRILLQKMDAHAETPGDLYRTIFIGMIDTIARTTMGAEMNLQTTDYGERLYDVEKQLMNNLQYRMCNIWLRWDWVYSLTKVARDEQIPMQNGNHFIEEMYSKKMDHLNACKAQGIDYLQEAKEKNATNFLEKCMLLEQSGVFNHNKVIDEMMVVLMAGIDTSSIVIFSTLLMLAINQKHQDLVVDELRAICETADCAIDQSHLIGMAYLERVIKETMRLLTPVPFFLRQTSADIVLSKGIIPRNTMVFISVLHMHRDPNIWGENVMDFDPDRFLPENIAKRPPFSYIPFSAGPRNCIGFKYAMISVKMTLAHLLRTYKFHTNLRFSDIRMKLHLVMEITNDKPMWIEKRQEF